MTESKIIFKLMLVLIFTLIISGCGSSKERDKAVSEAKTAKAELAKVKAVLEKTRRQKEVLEEDIAKISELCDNTESELDAVISSQEDLQDELDELTLQREIAIEESTAAQAIIEKLNIQLNEKEKQLQECQAWAVQLQTAIASLNSRLEETEKAEQPYEESAESQPQEPEDENNL